MVHCKRRNVENILYYTNENDCTFIRLYPCKFINDPNYNIKRTKALGQCIYSFKKEKFIIGPIRQIFGRKDYLQGYHCERM